MDNFKNSSDEDLCRICTSSEGGQILIFGSSGAERAILDKIQQCLPIKVSKKDGLPQTICGDCHRKLEEFWCFREFSRQTELKLAGMCSSESIKSDSDGSVSKMSEKEKGGSSLSLEKMSLKKNRYAQLSEPMAEDYVLMKEETINVDNTTKTSNIMADYLIEFNNNTRMKHETEMMDRDIVNAMRKRREVLPPMWDVFERVQTEQERQLVEAKPKGSKQALRTVLKGKFSVIHRRYIVAKGSFPCSLCGRCFRFNQGHPREGDEGDDVSDAESSDEIHPCSLCGRIFSSADALQRHEVTHSSENLNNIGIDASPATPAAATSTPVAVVAPPASDTTPSHSYTCTICNKVFARNEYLNRHMMLHAGERPFQCTICLKVFTRKEHLVRHRLTHGPDIDDGDEKAYTCELCSATFPRRDLFNKHKKAVHDIDEPEPTEPAKPFQCNFCLKTFTRKEHLKRHKKLHMRDIPTTVNSPQVVKQIGKDTVTLEISARGGENTEVVSNLLEQGRYGDVSIERKSVPVGLTADSSSFYNADNLTEEERAQLEGFLETSFGVDPVMLNSESSPRQIDTPTEQFYEEKDCIDLEDLKKMPKCRICAKAFTKKNHLNRHLKRYHNLSKEQVNSGKFEIYENGEKLLGEGENDDDSELLDDDGSPILKRPRCSFPCSVCRKTFTRKYHMYRHQKTQHGIEFPTREQQKDEVKCNDCGLIFLSPDELNSHECADDLDLDREPARRRPASAAGTFKCAICKVTFESHDGFKEHECKKVHRCTACGETFDKGRLLAKHMEEHIEPSHAT